jgi:hypothetical protein
VLVSILKKELDLKASMYEILQVLGMMLFEKTPIKSLFYADFNNFSKSVSCFRFGNPQISWNKKSGGLSIGIMPIAITRALAM